MSLNMYPYCQHVCCWMLEICLNWMNNCVFCLLYNFRRLCVFLCVFVFFFTCVLFCFVFFFLLFCHCCCYFEKFDPIIPILFSNHEQEEEKNKGGGGGGGGGGANLWQFVHYMDRWAAMLFPHPPTLFSPLLFHFWSSQQYICVCFVFSILHQQMLLTW